MYILCFTLWWPLASVVFDEETSQWLKKLWYISSNYQSSKVLPAELKDIRLGRFNLTERLFVI